MCSWFVCNCRTNIKGISPFVAKVVIKEVEIMKYSEYFGLRSKNQKNLDFVDGLINKDTKLYIDPAQIEIQQGLWFEESSKVVNSFFDTIFSLYKDGNVREAEALLINAHEPNETRLGVSSGIPKGRGSSPEKLIEVFRQILNEKLLEDKLISNYTDLNIFVKDFAEDRMSDLITNIIREKLAEYTVHQSKLHGLPLSDMPIKIGVGWDSGNLVWKDVYQHALTVNGKLLLLVPKTIVVQKYLFTVEEYLSRVVFDWRKRYHIENDTNLVRKKFVKRENKTKSYGPSNKTLIQKEIKDFGLTRKEYAALVSKDNLNLISDFRRINNYALIGTRTNRLNDEQLEAIVERKNRE
jgi:hypothetical protein